MQALSKPRRGAIRIFLSAVALLLPLLMPNWIATGDWVPKAKSISSPTNLFATLPLSFEENGGQEDRSIRFAARGTGYRLAFAVDEITMLFAGPAANPIRGEARTSALCKMKFVGANRATHVRGTDELAGKSHYFIGRDAKAWRTNLANFGRLKYEGLYKGIDAIFYGNLKQIEYDFLVAPGADVTAIRLSFAGIKQIRTEANGDLILMTATGDIRQQKPVAYQEIDGARRQVACAFKLLTQKRQTPLVAFELGAYDRSLPLVIDPVLDFSTYLGGDDNLGFTGTDVALDAEENIYIAGSTRLLPVPAETQTQEFLNREGVFVAKIDSHTKQLVYVANLTSAPGSFLSMFSSGIAVDASGNAYVTGSTSSPTFPTTAGVWQTTLQGQENAFITKFNPAGDGLVYSTIGGRSSDTGSAIDVDDDGIATVVGSTSSTDFPIHNPIQPRLISSSEAFATRLTATGTAVYSTYLGGNNYDTGAGVAIDNAGRAYILNTTFSPQFPQIAPLHPFMGPACFLARIVDSPLSQPAPTVSNVTPDAGAGQTRVTIKGANFLPGATVSFGSGLADAVTVIDANTIQATTPRFVSGRATITVMNPDGQVGVLEQAFDFLLTPLITQVMITGNRLVLYSVLFFSSGYGFDSKAVILIDGKEVKTDPPTSPSSIMSKKALKRIERGQSVILQVRNGNGLLSAAFPYTRP